jgi:hypothetical protein
VVAGTADGEEVDFEGGLTLLSKNGFADYRGVEYEIDPTNFTFAKSLFLPKLTGREDYGDAVAACRKAASGIPVSSLVDRPSNEGSAEVEGVDTIRVSGELEISSMIDGLGKLAADPICRSQLEAVIPLPLYELRQVGDELAGAVKRARVSVYVDDDNLVRKLEIEVTADPEGDGPERIAVDSEVSLSEVNEEQEIAAPSGAKPLLTLFAKLGVDSRAFFTLPNGGEVLRYLLEKIAADAFPQ